MLYLFALFFVIIPSSAGETEVKIDIVSALKNLMIPYHKDYSLDAVTVSEAFEGCIFDPFEYKSTKPRYAYLQEESYLNEPFHFKTKCILTYKNKYVVAKNLARDYKLNITMHGPKCCINILEITANYPNNLAQIVGDPRLEWKPIRCQKSNKFDAYEKWFAVRAPETKELYLKLSRSAGSGGTWENISIYWKLPKEFPLVNDEWSDKCSLE